MPASEREVEPVAEREVVITREFSAPARLLFEAFRNPEYLKRWFGPKGWPLTLCEMDFQVGGRFRFAMTGPDGIQGGPFGGEYLEIVPDRKIVYVIDTFDEPMTVTLSYDEVNGKTTLTYYTLFGSVAMKNEHVGFGIEAGINSGLDQLDDLVARLSAGTRSVVAHAFITLDGYIVGPDEDMNWVIEGFDPEMANDIAEAMSSQSDTFLLGRVTFEIFAAYWPHAVPYDPGDTLNPAGGKEDPRIIRALNDFPKIVFSRTLAEPGWQNARVVREGLEEEVRRLKRQPGKAINIQGSASIVQALARADLIDEYRLYVHPVLLGAGKQLFSPGNHRQDFALDHVKPYASGVVAMSYKRKTG